MVPWRNGQGTTTEIVARPSAPAEFVWRLSIADIPNDGPFSSFPGFDRTLMLIEGAGLVLRHEGHGEQRLDEPFQPVRFSGDWSTYCSLQNGATRDLNIITRRDSARHCATVLNGVGTHVHESAADTIALLCLRGAAAGRADATPFGLNTGETVLVDSEAGSTRTRVEVEARNASMVVVLVDISLVRIET